MQYVYRKEFKKQTTRLTKNQQKALSQRLKLFANDPHNRLLHNHALRGKYQGYRSIRISGDLRAIFWESQHLVEFVRLGSHSQLYG
jgi:addiction module RelE/StbE family toxin